MVFVLSPLVTIEPIDPPALPARWKLGRFRVRMRLFGLIPLGWQDIVVAEIQADTAAERWALRDAGGGALAQRWDHHMSARTVR